MRRSSFLTQYTRAAFFSDEGVKETLGESVLGLLAAGEYSFIMLLLEASK